MKAGLYEQFVADFYEWKKGQFATTGEQRKRLNAALGELAREAIDKEETRFRLRQDFVCEYLGEPDDADSLFGLALRLGWLNQVGVDGENPRKAVYAFFHPTFQEYFAAFAQHWSDATETLDLLTNLAFSNEEQGARSVAVKELARLSSDSPDILSLLKAIVVSKSYIPYFRAAALDALATNYPDDLDTFSLLWQFTNSNEDWDIRGQAL